MAMTAAEKQKRYREKKSNAKVTESVTNSNGNALVTLDGNAVDVTDKNPQELSQDLPDTVTDKAPGSSDSIGLRYEIVEGEKVYGRQAVRYTKLAEPWDTRPQPDDPLDIPRMNNRGIYTRLDGTSYQIDACGKAHNRNKKGEIYAGKDYLNARKEREAAKDVEVAV